MLAVTESPRIEVNGHAATAAELAHPALSNYGHFTMMQVRGGRTRGLDLHLARLDAASRELFGGGLGGERVRAGFDDALLVDADGIVQEGGVTNLGCYDGTEIVWPDAPMLDGITMLLIERADMPSRRGPVHVEDLGSYASIFVTNSLGVAAVERVDDLRIPVDHAFMKTLTHAYDSVPWDAI